MIIDPTNVRRDGHGSWDSLGERALTVEAAECYNEELVKSNARFEGFIRRRFGDIK